MIIKNYRQLISHGDKEARIFLLSIVNEVLRHENYQRRIRAILKKRGDYIKLGGDRFNLKDFKNVYLVGGGKYSSYMVRTVADIIGPQVKQGIVSDKCDINFTDSRIEFIKSGHPVPDENSFNAGEKILNLISKMREDDLLIVCVSGGWTSTIVSKPATVRPSSVQQTYELLLRSGMTLKEMNMIRNRLSLLAGGNLINHTKAKTIIGLIAVDEVGGKPWGPTVYDMTSRKDLEKVIDRYLLSDKLPEDIHSLIRRFKRITMSKEKNVFNYVISENREMCEFAYRVAKSRSVTPYILTSSLEGEAKDVGLVLAEIANEISLNSKLNRRPCLLIAGGETTVTLSKQAGVGGRNQELLLSAAIRILQKAKIAMVAIGTDGTDGPTNIAGAIVDRFTRQRMINLNIDPLQELKDHNSSKVFLRLKDALFTADTVTNLMDLLLLYVR